MKPIRNSQFAIRNDARGLATATLTQLNQDRHNGQRVSTYLGIQGLFRATCGRKRVAGRSTVLNLHFFHENIQTTLRYQKITSSRAESVAKSALDNLVNNI